MSQIRFKSFLMLFARKSIKTLKKRLPVANIVLSLQLGSKLEKSYHDLMDEKTLNKAMSENLGSWQKRVTALEDSLHGYKASKEMVSFNPILICGVTCCFHHK